MRIPKLMAVGVSGCALVAAVTLPATAGPAHNTTHPSVASKTKTFPSTLNRHTVKPGQALILHGHGAKKSAAYSCVLVVIKGAKFSVGPIKNIKSTKKGKITCKVTYHPYTAQPFTAGGKSHHCPLTAKDKKAHWRCGMAVSNLAQTSATIQYFTAKK